MEGGVTATGPDGNVREAGGFPVENRPELRKGHHQVSADIVVERLQGRDVYDAGMPGGRLSRDQPVDGPQECRQGLAAARGGGDEQMPAGCDGRP